MTLKLFILVNHLINLISISILARLYPSKSVKYLGVKIDKNLDWKVQTDDIVTKLNRANALLSKIRNYVRFNTLKAIYFAIFNSFLNYVNLIFE